MRWCGLDYLRTFITIAPGMALFGWSTFVVLRPGFYVPRGKDSGQIRSNGLTLKWKTLASQATYSLQLQRYEIEKPVIMNMY